ncbi:hypothetical protein [Nostoc sp.]|uniref:hypothetical protein n=1 Tax=Nostoc sp. TaxID=1180 RepID=UPI002FFB2367
MGEGETLREQIGEPQGRIGFSASLWLVYLDNLFLGNPSPSSKTADFSRLTKQSAIA